MAIRSDDETVRARFKREIQLARSVTHRNVCRILEAGATTSAAGSTVLFVTMELLHGETLADRLGRERGP